LQRTCNNYLRFKTDDLSDLYHNRWEIEEFYKFLKVSLGGTFYNFKIINSLEQHLESQFLVSIFVALIHNFDKKSKPIGFKASPKYTLKFLRDFAYYVLYNPRGTQKILKTILVHIWKVCLTKIINGRSFPRTAVVRHNRWYCNNDNKL
jgi:hypothetical protein